MPSRTASDTPDTRCRVDQHVVLGAHPGQEGDLLAAQPLHTAAAPEVGQARLQRGEAFAP